ncbi:Sau3AI family type II restriction endonuclease [Staphylococcus chromogenes]|uniref:Sau3AI family type II restriction endonuclease n=2 Tax=Staphylococcus chromogenes TaxID=46126 RepID=UPI002886813E|nr:Sau3AI family type II restriction endonuclease [Staphylococcus chromogenes]MDT0693476.1 Sau3AI family type II restriction endonuclease [Staphylococcus chromogenes]MDT0701022.1 Sau3AI family type II restriction endonuclease [Staphylococcus chromogenes]
MGEIYKTKEQVHNRALEAVNLTLEELSSEGYEPSKKSSFGDAFENWFGKLPDSESKPDLEEAGVELKATPFKKLKNGKFSAKERLVLNLINYNELIHETFETSKFLYKNKTIELAFYENNPEVDKREWFIKTVILYQMEKNPKDFEIIRQDWEKIYQFVDEGRAHELSEKYFQYLSPCTKSKNSSVTRSQPHSDIEAKPRAFSFKSGFMTALLRDYVLGEKKCDSIIKDKYELKDKNIEEIIFEKFKPYIGKTVIELCEYFSINSKSKSLNQLLASAMLNLNGNHTINKEFGEIEEFEKASIVVKTVQVNEKNKNKEHMSFPKFNFKELVEEEWTNEEGEPSATWHNFLLESRFLFVVFKEVEDDVIFKGIKFHSIPEDVINTTIKDVWQDTKDKLNEGVILKVEPRNNSKGYIVRNNLIKHSDGKICHVRPHAAYSDYRENGKYANQLPTPAKWINHTGKYDELSKDWMTDQSFWLNNAYINQQIADLLD